MYEPGRTVLRYEEHFGSAAPPPPSQELFPSESSHGSEGSQETADSGHYSNEESNEEMSSPSSGQHSRPDSFGLDDPDAEEKPSFKVENEAILGRSCRDSAPEAPPSRRHSEKYGLTPNAPDAADS